jgi:hypothetical protein
MNPDELEKFKRMTVDELSKISLRDWKKNEANELALEKWAKDQAEFNERTRDEAVQQLERLKSWMAEIEIGRLISGLSNADLLWLDSETSLAGDRELNARISSEVDKRWTGGQP